MSFAPVFILELLACTGLGAAGLRGLGLLERIPARERLSWSFALGFGLLSLLVFALALAGILSAPAMGLLLGAAALGCLWLMPPPLEAARTKPTTLGWALLVLLLVVLALYLAGGLAPPADGDSMAYHFARIKQTVHDGRLTFLPQAVEGAAPMMSHMTYLPAYILGGEKGLTLWTTASGLMTSLFLYTAARRWLAPSVSLLLALVLMTTPAAVFGTSSGQVEIRNAHFVLLGALAVMQARRDKDWRWLVLAGLGSGFFAGAKVFGLLWVAACGLAATWRRDWLKAGMLFGLAALVGACPWYLWNFAQSGDPLFPMLQRLLGIPDGPLWTLGHLDMLVANLKRVEQPVAPSLGWFLAYPFVATLKGLPFWESGRTGLGVFCLLALPFAIVGAWRRSAESGRSPLWTAALLLLLFYALWFFLGTAQRVRHLLPLYPLLLLTIGVAAWRYVKGRDALMVGTLAVLAIQTAGLGLFQLSALKFHAGAEDRTAYLERSISLYNIVPWLNANLTANDRLLTDQRQLLYHLDAPYFFGHPLHQARIDLRPGRPVEPGKRWREMRALGITHVLMTPSLADPEADTALHRTMRVLLERGCVREVHAIDGQVFVSRTLSGITNWTERLEIYRLVPESCPLEPNLQNGPNPFTNTQIPSKESSQ